MPAGTAQGLGMWCEYKSIVAYLMECDTRRPVPRITRCTVAGELGLPAACSAAANAWARATGRQVRRFPINEYGG